MSAPNLNTLILTPSDYSVILSFNSAAGVKQRYLFLTASELTYDDSVEGEYIRAIGQTGAIGNKTNNESYKGGWSVQSGEWNSILQLGGYQSGMQIQGATLSIAALVGAFAKTYRNLNILKDSGAITAGGKQTMNKLDWQAIGLG